MKRTKTNKSINIGEIIKKCPIGTKLYSPICGEVKLNNYNLRKTKFPIEVYSEDIQTILEFDNYGKVIDNCPNAECLLFPSKNMRNWNKFKIPKEDLKINTICVCFNEIKNNIHSLSIKHYAGNGHCFDYENNPCSWKNIIPIDHFNFDDFTFDEKYNYGSSQSITFL